MKTDSAECAVSLLYEAVALSDDVKCAPDPQIPWVWLVVDHGIEKAFIVYLADDDWEEVESYKSACSVVQNYLSCVAVQNDQEGK